MKKLVRFRFRDKTVKTFPIEQAEQILNSERQLVMLYDEEGKWTGQTINKGEILGTDRDFEEERIETSRKDVTLLSEPNMTNERRKELLERYKPKKV